MKQELDASGEFDSPIVTEISPAGPYYRAEDYHMDFYDRNREYGYCRVVIDPKITKLYKEFSGALATT